MRNILRSLVRVAALALFAAPAMGSALPSPGTEVPSPSNSTIPACITLVGQTGGIPAHEFGAFEVVHRDLANNPIPGATVMVAFWDCLDLHICADQQDPDAIVDCQQTTVSKLTDSNGRARFTIVGGSNGAGNGLTLLNGARIYADGMLLGSPTAAAYDLDGTGGVGVNDLSVWLVDFGLGVQYGRSEFDCNGDVGINDFAVLLRVYGAGTQVASCAASCP